jgi:phosphohistidine phosphatase SixA
VRIYLCRHAHAAAGEPDELRELTDDGRAQARKLGQQLSGVTEPPVVVLSSPLVRARQTAESVARALGTDVRVDDRLAPGATPGGLRAAVEGLEGPVATVGHQPDCSEITLALTGRDPGFPAGGMAVLELGPQPS